MAGRGRLEPAGLREMVMKEVGAFGKGAGAAGISGDGDERS